MKRELLSNSLKTILTIFCLAVATFANWQSERWIAEPFTQVLASGPETGSMQQSGVAGRDVLILSMTSDKDGNIYVGNSEQLQFIDIITKDGIRRHLAGTGEPGYRDGLAQNAQLRCGIKGNGYGQFFNIACGSNGNIYLGDTGNKRVRRINKKDGVWYVDTWAGGGTKSFTTIGEKAASKDVDLSNKINIAVNSNGEVIIATAYKGNFKVSIDGDTVTYLGKFINLDGVTSTPNLMMGASDTVGNVYFVSRTPDLVLRINLAGDLAHIAGAPREARSAPDGPPLEAYFDTPTSIAAEPNGSCVYICGGDEYRVRRVPTDSISTTTTLMQNGTWRKLPSTPRSFSGTTNFSATADSSKALTICHIAGNDSEGNLFGLQNSWTGESLKVEGILLTTRVFKLRRVN